MSKYYLWGVIGVDDNQKVTAMLSKKNPNHHLSLNLEDWRLANTDFVGGHGHSALAHGKRLVNRYNRIFGKHQKKAEK